MTQASTATTTASQKLTQIQGPVSTLGFKEGGEDAVNFYVSLIPNSRIISIARSDGNNPIPKGGLLNATFELNGREFFAFDGGPSFSFTVGFSLMVTCQTQEEIDELWERLSDSGEKGPCGWLTDRWGVSWQIVPAVLGQMLSDSKSGNSQKAMEAMLQMGKLDIAELERAYRSKS
jgi:predicted 3-demethylubiquinone-9 3-methyltransferase (glyoxalase superfamily)